MKIGQIIRAYRKDRGLTQEEMARRLGVSAPAVNKWENGNSLPDISMLAPIARLLQVSLDELLGYREELTGEEIVAYVQELDRKLKSQSYPEAFSQAKKIMETYPNCLWLSWQFAVLLEAHLLMKDKTESDARQEYESYIVACYKRVLECDDEKLRTGAADSLFNYYLRKQEYDKAEACLAYYSGQNPERKRKQGMIRSKTGRTAEAYKTYEELLLSGYQMMSATFQSLYMLAREEGDHEKASYYAEKQSKLAGLFEMGEYHETASLLEPAITRGDKEEVQKIQEKLMSCVDTVAAFRTAPLYSHMSFKEARPEYLEEMKENLREAFSEIEK